MRATQPQVSFADLEFIQQGADTLQAVVCRAPHGSRECGRSDGGPIGNNVVFRHSRPTLDDADKVV